MNRAERRAQMRERIRAPKTSSIALHIDELVLHGFPVRGRHVVGDAVQAELVRLLHTSLPQFVTNAKKSGAIDGGSFNATPQTKPNAIGKLIANAVYGGCWR